MSDSLLTAEQQESLRREAGASAGPDQPRAKLRVLDVARMVAESPPPVPWLVQGLVVEGCLSLLTGREGEGKSLLAFALAVGVALGESAAGLDCERGGVLIVDAENGEHEIHRRVHSLGLPAAGVTMVEAEGFHLGRDLAELTKLIEEQRPSLVILDSFRSLWPGGNENDTAEVAEVLDPLRNMLRAKGAAGLLLHHLSKAGGNYRGSTALGAAVELGFKLDRAEGDPEATDRRRLACFKCRPAPEPKRRWIRFHIERSQVFVEQTEPYEDDERPVQVGRPRQRDEYAPQLLAAAREPKAWSELAEAIRRDSKDGTARRLRDDLLKQGELVELSDGRYQAVEGATGVMAPRSAHEQGENGSGAISVRTPKGAGVMAPEAEDALFERFKQEFDADEIDDEDRVIG